MDPNNLKHERHTLLKTLARDMKEAEDDIKQIRYDLDRFIRISNVINEGGK